MRFVAMLAFFVMCTVVVAGCSGGGGSGGGNIAPVNSQNSNNNGGNNPPPTGSTPNVASMSDAQLIAATPAFANQGLVVVTRRLDSPGGSTIVGAGAVAFAEPRPDPSDNNVMLVDFVADYGYDGNTTGLVEAWAKQNAPIINMYDAVRLTSSGSNGYRGTLRVPVAQGMHFTLLKTSPSVIAAAATVDPSWFFTGLPYDSTYDNPPQELRVWVAKDGSGTWHVYVKPSPGATVPPPPASQLPNPSGSGTPSPGALQITAASGSPSPVTEEQPFTLQASASGGSGTLSYQWTQFSGPTATIANPTSQTTAATAPTSATAQLMEFTLRVTDQNGSVTTTVSVTVQPVTDLSIASTSVSPNAIQGGSTSTLAVVTSGGKGVIHYSWAQLSGPAVTIAQPQSASTTLTAPFVASSQTATFAVTVSDDRDNIQSQPVSLQITPFVPPNTAPVFVAASVSGVDSSSSTIAALTTATVQVCFRDDNGDPLNCTLSRRAGEQASISLLSSATVANLTTFTFAVQVDADPATVPGSFTFDAVASDPGGLQAVMPQRQVTVHRRNRFADLAGYRMCAAQVDEATASVNEGPGTIALGTLTIVTSNEVDLDVFIDYPTNWVGNDISVQSGWTPHVFRNPLTGGVGSSYYDGTPLTLVRDYGTGKVFKATVRLRTDIGEHLLWATRNGSSSPGDPANVFMARQDRNHNYDNVDPDRGYKIVINQATQDVTIAAAPAVSP